MSSNLFHPSNALNPINPGSPLHPDYYEDGDKVDTSISLSAMPLSDLLIAISIGFLLSIVIAAFFWYLVNKQRN